MKRIIIIHLCILCLNPIFAQKTKPNICSPTGVLVNSFTGNMYYFREDLSVPTIGNNQLDFSFYYNSANAQKNYGYGKGWTFTFHMRYFLDSLGVVIETNNGMQDLYTYDGSGYTAPKGNQNSLKEITKGKFQLTTSSGDNFYFENAQSKRVTRMVYVNHNEITLAYNDTLITSVTDPAGRVFSLTWNGSLLSKIAENFGAKKLSVNYAYDDSLRLTTVTDPMGNKLTYAYNEAGQLNELTDKNGHSTFVEYNINNAVKRIRNEYCDRTIRYDSIQKISVVVDHVASGNQFTTYRYDNKERIIAHEGSCCGDDFRYEYDDQDNIVAYTDANGNKSTFTYDDKGNRLTATNALGHITKFSYQTKYNKITGITLPEGNQQGFKYDEAGNLTKISLPDNSTQKLEYNAQGLLKKSTDALGNKSSLEYDSYGNLSSVTNAKSETTSLECDAYGNVNKITNPLGGFITFTYDKLGQVTQIENSIGAIQHFEYDAEGNLTKQTDALNHITRFEYDGMNRLVKTINALNGTSQMSYNEMGKIIALVNELGHKTQFSYDAKNRLSSTTNPLSETTNYLYDAVGNITGLKLPNDNVLSYQYNTLDLVTEVSDALGTIATYTYDKNGNRITETDALGNITKLKYDNRDRLILVILPLQNTASLSYDVNSNMIEQTDGEGAKTKYEYDALNRLIKSINAEKGEVSYAYDELGNIQSLTDPNGNKTTYEYDPLGRLLKEVFPDNETARYAYDKLNNITSKIKNNGDVIKYSYDELNRLTQKKYPDNTSATYAFDALGRMTIATNSDATLDFGYDAAGRLLAETLNGKTTAYTYNVLENRQSIVYPSGRVIDQLLDKRGQLSVLKDNDSELVNFAYLANGQMSQKKYRNGLTTDYIYDDNSRLARIFCSNTLDLNYTYNLRNHIASLTNGIKADWSEAYQYDQTGQVTNFKQGTKQDGSIPNPLEEVGFVYDAAGNRTKVTGNGSVEDYTTNNMNAYTRIAKGETITPEYDKNGNMLFDGKHRYNYNYDNKIINVDNGTTATYGYDALGRRIKKATATDTTLFYYAGQHVIEEHNEAGQLKAEYIFGQNLDEIICLVRNGENYFYHTDILGSVHALSNSKGKIAEKYQYEAFGKPAVYDENNTLMAQSKINNTYLFTGRQWDNETQLYYYRARYYSAELGRFLQNDPIGYWDDINFYRYCGNDGVNCWDLLGLQESSECSKPQIYNLLKDPFDPINIIKNLNAIEEKFESIIGNRIPDYYVTGFSLSTIYGTGIEINIGAITMLAGKDAGKVIPTLSIGQGVGLDTSLSGFGGVGFNNFGNTDMMNVNDFTGSGFSMGAGAGPFGVGAGVAKASDEKKGGMGGINTTYTAGIGQSLSQLTFSASSNETFVIPVLEKIINFELNPF